MNEICDKMGDATPEELEQYMEDLGTIQDLLTMHDFYMIDAKVEEVARALGLMEIGLDRDVTELSGGQRTKVLPVREAGYPALGRAYQLSGCGAYRMAEALSERIRECFHSDQP